MNNTNITESRIEHIKKLSLDYKYWEILDSSGSSLSDSKDSEESFESAIDRLTDSEIRQFVLVRFGKNEGQARQSPKYAVRAKGFEENENGNTFFLSGLGNQNANGNNNFILPNGKKGQDLNFMGALGAIEAKFSQREAEEKYRRSLEAIELEKKEKEKEIRLLQKEHAKEIEHIKELHHREIENMKYQYEATFKLKVFEIREEFKAKLDDLKERQKPEKSKSEEVKDWIDAFGGGANLLSGLGMVVSLFGKTTPVLNGVQESKKELEIQQVTQQSTPKKVQHIIRPRPSFEIEKVENTPTSEEQPNNEQEEANDIDN
jgi:hypothetical protein